MIMDRVEMNSAGGAAAAPAEFELITSSDFKLT